MKKYLLDANVFITPANSYYTLEGCPGFWEWLDEDDALCSIQMVRTELLGKEDDLARWIKAKHGPDFLEPTEDVQRKLVDVSQHVMEMEDFNQAKKEAFLDGADPWLIATALSTGWPIVTMEKYAPDARKKIFLPVVAQKMKVTCMHLFELTALRRLRLVREKGNTP